MAFPRARIKRFNEPSENTPGVGAYNVATDHKVQMKELDRSLFLKKIEQSCKLLKDKGHIAAAKGELPKHVEELHHRLRAAEEKTVDFEILKISADKEREMLRSDYKLVSAEISTLKESMKELEFKKKQAEDTIKTLLEQKKIMSVETEKLLTEKQKISEELSKSCLKLEVMNAQHSQLQDKIADLQQTEIKLKEECEKLQKDKSVLADENVALAAKFRDLFECQEKLKKFEEEKAAREMQLRESYKSLAEQRAQEVAQLEERLSEIESLNTHLCSCVSDLENVKELNEQEIRKLQMEVDRKDKQLLELNEQVEHLQQQLQKEITAGKEELFQLQSANETLSKLLISKDEELTILNLELLQTSEVIQKLKEEYEQLDQIYSGKQQSEMFLLEQAKLDVEAMQTQIEEEREQLDHLKNELSIGKAIVEENLKELEEKTNILDAEKESLVRKEKALEEERVTLDELKQILDEKLTIVFKEEIQLKEEYERVHNAMISEYTMKQAQLEADHKEWQTICEGKFMLKIDAVEKEKEEFLIEQGQLFAQKASDLENCKKYLELNYKEKFQVLENSKLEYEHSVEQKFLQKVQELEREKEELFNEQIHIFEQKLKSLEDDKRSFQETLKQEYLEKFQLLDQAKQELEESCEKRYQEKVMLIKQDQEKFVKDQNELFEQKVQTMEVANMSLRERLESEFEERGRVKEELFNEQNHMLEEKLKSLEDDKRSFQETLEQEYLEKFQLLEQAKQELEESCEKRYQENVMLIKQDQDKFVKDQNELFEQKVQTMEVANMSLRERLESEFEERFRKLEESKCDYEYSIEKRYNDKLKLAEQERDEFLRQAKELWEKQVKIQEEKLKESHREAEHQLQERLNHLLDKVKQHKHIQAESKELILKLEEELSCLQNSCELQKKSHEHKIKELNKVREGAVEFYRCQINSLQAKYKELDMKFEEVGTENKRLNGVVELLQDEIVRVNEEYDLYKLKQEATVRKLEEAADREKDGLNLIIEEMSDKIQQMEEALAEVDNSGQDWKSLYEELDKRMEPFKDILDAYELERKLLQDRDRYTHDQIEQLTKEAIKNMGHQNHKQKLKYMEKLKQEHVTLQKKLCEASEEVQRQQALVKKYKERVEKLEGGKDLAIKKTPAKTVAPSTPRIPLKEGNR